ncbi:hypothetical protein [Microbacterium sp. 1P10AE]|uniref:hypothetical protein n=1 Tax=Microbacterium sp. 1P10AE TaxID=3132286 RepID=UPI0039A3B16A
MSQKTTHRILSAVLTTSAAGVLLAGCVGSPDAAPATSLPAASASAPTSSETATPPASDAAVSQDDAIAVVKSYLSAVQAEQWTDAYALLSDGARTAVGSEQQFADAAASGIVRPDAAAGYLGTDGVIEATEGPVAGSVLVTAVRDRIADAWLVRPADGDARIDDAGVPPTGQSPYEWVNPAAGPEDVRDVAPLDPSAPAAIIFTDLAEDAGENLVGYPDELTAYLGTTEAAASLASSEDQLRWDIPVDTEQLASGTVPLTVVWKAGGDGDLWRTSTTALFLP